jgi:uncharacterized membrane protein YphA (DoxX/SURF4 family)
MKLAVGRVVFAVAIASLGVLSLVYGDVVAGLEPLPAPAPGKPFIGYLTGIVLLAAGVGVLIDRTARVAAVSLGVVFTLWVLLLHVPNLAQHPREPNAWTIAFETLALCGATWVLAGTVPGDPTADPRRDRMLEKARTFGRIAFGVSLPIFGIQHYMYAEFVSALVPAWLPARLFLAYFTGTAFFAAGLSIATTVKARLAAMLLAIMFGTWVFILHLPRAAAKLDARLEWTSLCIAMAMCGSAWLIATSLREKRGDREARGLVLEPTH